MAGGGPYAAEKISAAGSIFAQERKLIQKAPATLPEEQVVAIELAFFHGLTDTELARALGSPTVAVRKRIRLGMWTLREVLETVARLENPA